MTIIYNERQYDVTAESIYRDFAVPVATIDDAVTIIEDMADMTTYTFNSFQYAGMAVKKRMIVIDANGIQARIILKEVG